MLLVLVALVLSGPTLRPYPTPNLRSIPSEPSATTTAENPRPEIGLAELQVLRIRVVPLTTPPVLPPVESAAPVTSGTVASLPQPKAVIKLPSRKIWIGLAAGEHAAAIFDAWTTRRSLATGYTRELNPLVRPFSRSAAVYPALQVVPTAFDLISRRMMQSSHPLLRKTWWLLPTMGMTASILCGVHNLQFMH